MESHQTTFSYLLQNQSQHLLYQHLQSREDDRSHNRDGLLSQKRLRHLDRQPQVLCDRRYWILVQLKSQRIDEWSRGAPSTSLLEAHAQMVQSPAMNGYIEAPWYPLRYKAPLA